MHFRGTAQLKRRGFLRSDRYRGEAAFIGKQNAIEVRRFLHMHLDTFGGHLATSVVVGVFDRQEESLQDPSIDHKAD